MKTMIICANGLEECEALLTYDLLTRAGIEVHLVGLEKEITSSHKLTFKTNYLLNEIDIRDYDCLVLPGGMPGTTNLESNILVQNTIDYFVEHNKYIAAVCAAPSILIHKGLLQNNKFTCFPGCEENMSSTHQKVEQDGKFITGIALGGTIEFALKIIENLCGKDVSNKVKNTIQY